MNKIDLNFVRKVSADETYSASNHFNRSNAIHLALREALCHFNSFYGQSILCPNTNMAPCHDQMFFDAFFARDRIHLSRAGYNVLANILHCYIHTFSTKPLQTYTYMRGR